MRKKNKSEIIGTEAIDRDIYDIQLKGETLTPEEVDAEITAYEAKYGVVETPVLKSDKFSYLDFIIDGKPIEETDDILQWISDMTKQGRENELPDKIKDLVVLYHKTHAN